MSQSAPIKNKFIVGLCFAISIAIHGIFLGLIETNSLWFCSSVVGTKPNPSRSIRAVSHDQILKEAFATLPATEIPFVPPQIAKTSTSLAARSIKEPPETSKILTWSPNFPLFSVPLETFDFSPPLEIRSMPKINLRNIQGSFLEGLILPPLESVPTANVKQLDTPLTQQQLPLSSLTIANNQPSIDSSIDIMAFLSENAPFIPGEDESLSTRAPSIPLPDLPQFLSLAELDTVNLSDAFTAELTFFAKPEDSGYLFALTLIPREDLQLPKIHQRITFLIDRSNSIQKERLIASKQAVLRALEELDEEDSFNIIAFDSKTEKLFPSFSLATPSALSKAEEFIDKIQLGSFFSTSDPYRPLLHTIPYQVKEDEIYTAILLTDGETLSSKTVQHALTHDWTLQNRGKVSLFIVGMETDPNSTMLETLCTLNRGRLIQSSSQRGLKRQILKLAKNIKTPLAKDLSSKIICRTSDHRIEIYPQSQLSPHLYLNQPYVILGTTDTLDDFLVFIQGRLKDQWLNIKKTISFVNAKKGNSSLITAFQQYDHLNDQLVDQLIDKFRDKIQ